MNIFKPNAWVILVLLVIELYLGLFEFTGYDRGYLYNIGLEPFWIALLILIPIYLIIVAIVHFASK